MSSYQPIRRRQVNALVRELQSSHQDFEWYPTTDEIVQAIKSDLRDFAMVRSGEDIKMSVLDCGAGDGRVLAELTEGPRYAIEKAQPLISVMTEHREVFVVGSDFHKQTLIDKKVGCIFSNPPYKEYEAWATKIIREGNAAVAYLVIPARWEQSTTIREALELRKALVSVIGEFTFEDADRQARAKVHVVKVNLYGFAERHYANASTRPRVDPFDVWFHEHFKVAVNASPLTEFDQKSEMRQGLEERVEADRELVKDEGLVNTLERLYHRDLEHLVKNYQSVCSLDPGLLQEMGVNVRDLKEGLRLKIESLKDVYWNHLLSNLDAITSRLTSASRQKMLNTITANTSVDFNAENAHGLVIWMIHNAHDYMDQQLIKTYERMVERANIQLYTSNQRVFRDDEWRYWRRPDDLERYKLDYRVVLERVGGMEGDQMLSETAREFLMDIATIAGNVGFDTKGLMDIKRLGWERGKALVFEYRTLDGELKTLMEVRAFLNGNLHIRFAPAFILRLNVEFGRLKGWVRNPQEAAREMDITVEEAEAGFAGQLRIVASDLSAVARIPVMP